jgi:hypothetical protein
MSSTVDSTQDASQPRSSSGRDRARRSPALRRCGRPVWPRAASSGGIRALLRAAAPGGHRLHSHALRMDAAALPHLLHPQWTRIVLVRHDAALGHVHPHKEQVRRADHHLGVHAVARPRPATPRVWPSKAIGRRHSARSPASLLRHYLASDTRPPGRHSSPRAVPISGTTLCMLACTLRPQCGFRGSTSERTGIEPVTPATSGCGALGAGSAFWAIAARACASACCRPALGLRPQSTEQSCSTSSSNPAFTD